MTTLHLMLSIQQCRAEGFHSLAAALEAILRKQISRQETKNTRSDQT